MGERIDIEALEVQRLNERFVTRSWAAFWVRLSISIFVVVMLAMEEALEWLPLVGVQLVLMALAIRSVEHVLFGRWLQFLSLLCDVVGAGVLISLTGGVQSPFLVLTPLFAILFTLLFHGWVAVVPPLLLLPVVTIIDLQNGIELDLDAQLILLGLHALVNGVAVFLTNYILSREEYQSRHILRLERKLKTLAVVEERQRLAREMHDGVGAALSGVIIQSEYALMQTPKEAPIRPELDEIKLAAEDAIDELRRALSMMRDDFEITAQIKNICSTYEIRHRLPISVQLQGEPPVLPQSTSLTIFRIMQECLTNVAKHAKAQHVDVAVDFSMTGVRLHIRDDGVGFKPDQTPAGHYGLLNLAERAKQIGAQLHVQSQPGSGTNVELTLAV